MARITEEVLKKRQRARERRQREKEAGKPEIEPDDFPGDGLAKRAAELINKDKKRKGKRLSDIMRQIRGN